MVCIGCSGWSYEHWRGLLYPEHGPTGAWLPIYARRFDTVEVNATFYRLPTRDAVARWAAGSPDRFCFAVKASRYLTHVRRLRGLEEGLLRLEERIAPMRSASKLGPILWQLPGNFHRDEERLAQALDVLPAGRHAFEFRHESWFRDSVYDLLRRRGAALVVADRAPAEPSPWVETADWSYLWFHAGRGRDGNYTRRQLESWAERIAGAKGDVYAYFNNDWHGHAVENAERLRALLGQRPARGGGAVAAGNRQPARST